MAAVLLVCLGQVSPTVTFTATLPPAQGGHYEIFTFGAGDGVKPRWNGLDSQHIRLNGQLLKTITRGSLPALEPQISTKADIETQPLTITFVTVPGVAACL